MQRCTHKIFLISPITKSKFREIIKLGFREIFLKFREIFAKQEVEFFLQIFREFQGNLAKRKHEGIILNFCAWLGMYSICERDIEEGEGEEINFASIFTAIVH